MTDGLSARGPVEAEHFNSGVKYDTGKTRYDLVPYDTIAQIPIYPKSRAPPLIFQDIKRWHVDIKDLPIADLVGRLWATTEIVLGGDPTDGWDGISAYPRVTKYVARVMTFGATKYEANNWRKGMDWWRLLPNATMRHIEQHVEEEEFIDEESGEPHLACACTDIMFAYHYELNGIGKRR